MAPSKRSLVRQARKSTRGTCKSVSYRCFRSNFAPPRRRLQERAGGAANSWENDGEFFLRMKVELHAGVSLRRFGHIQSYHQSHVFTGEERIWEELLRVPFDLIEKGVIMVRIVVGQDQPLDSGALRAFDPLQVA